MKGLLDEIFAKREQGDPPRVGLTTDDRLASIDQRLQSVEKLVSKSNSELGCITAFLWIIVALAALGFLLGWCAGIPLP